MQKHRATPAISIVSGCPVHSTSRVIRSAPKCPSVMVTPRNGAARGTMPATPTTVSPAPAPAAATVIRDTTAQDDQAEHVVQDGGAQDDLPLRYRATPRSPAPAR
jgi:hypothetical protein